MKVQSAEEYLLSIPFWSKQKNSFEDIRMFLKELGIEPEFPGFRIIHVAGTNGKGSVCAFLTSVLVEADFHTGTFTSPHLVDIRERFMIDGVMVSQELFEYSYERVRTVTDRMMQSSYQHPTFFEFVFLMAMVMFRESGVDFAVLETGLGGRLDTTNVIQHPEVTVITSISMDHMEYLGDTIIKIASEKAGIIKEEVPVVYDDNNHEASAVITESAGRLHAPAYPVNRKDLVCRTEKDGRLLVTVKEEDGEHSYSLPFIAEYQAMNAVLAVRTVRALKLSISQDVLKEGIRKTVWPGRMEEVLPGVYLDGAHNAGGIQAFAETAKQLGAKTGKKLYLLFAAVSDKEYEKMIEYLCRELPLSGIITAHIGNDRGLDEGTLEQTFKTYASCPVQAFTRVEDAVKYMVRIRQGDELIFCAGSLYLIGEIKASLRRIQYD